MWLPSAARRRRLRRLHRADFVAELSSLELWVRFSSAPACSQIETVNFGRCVFVLGCVDQITAFFNFNGNAASMSK